MIRIAFFDVGETLVHGGRAIEGAVDALDAISQFETAVGKPLLCGVISNYHLATEPVSEAKIVALEQRYREEVLEPTGLSGLFEPFESRVTISSRANVAKPARRIFEIALERIESDAGFEECLFVTEETGHLEQCRELGITPVHFGGAVSGMASFADWADGPAVIAHLVDPQSARNRARAAAVALVLRYGLVGFTALESTGQTIRGRANRLVKLEGANLGPLEGIFAERPCEVEVELNPDGRVRAVDVESLSPDEIADSVNFVSSLLKSGRVQAPGVPPQPFGTTHEVRMDEKGRRRLVRRGFS